MVIQPKIALNYRCICFITLVLGVNATKILSFVIVPWRSLFPSVITIIIIIIGLFNVKETRTVKVAVKFEFEQQQKKEGTKISWWIFLVLSPLRDNSDKYIKYGCLELQVSLPTCFCLL